jgi:cytochrome c oxidase cbb3-type subunit 3
MRIPPVLASASIELFMAASLAFSQATRPPATAAKSSQTFPAELVSAGETLFVQHCAFCHGRDTGGGESGPDLTRSKLVADDTGGNQIGPVVRNGRNAMPRFTVTDQELLGLTAFIHTQKNIAEA